MKSAVVVACFAVLLGLKSYPAAQSLTGPVFEVASVKPGNPDAGGLARAGIGRTAGGRFTASNIQLQELVSFAYDRWHFQVVGGPPWRTSRTFDIQAKSKDPSDGRDALLAMLKTLLADRFQLKVHTERREMPTYALVVARDDGRLGARVTRSAADCVTAEKELAAVMAKNDGSLAALLQAGKGLPCAITPVPARGAGTMTMRANGASMAIVASFLTSATGRMVEDRTGLSGLYDWEMAYDPEEPLRAAQPTATNTSLPAPPSESPSLMTALREQLGLTLRPGRGSVEVLVIDSAALPEPD